MTVTVALAGATGKIGPFILDQLLQGGFKVIILTRQNSHSTDSISPHQNLSIERVDWDDKASLISALTGVDVVVSTLTASAASNSKPFIDAAAAAGVQRFIPAEFSVDVEDPKTQRLPVFQAKLQTEAYLKKVAASHSNFSYTLIFNSVWLDWGIEAGFILDLEAENVTLYDGGDVPFSTTTRISVGKAVVAVINHMDVTRNRSVRVHDAVLTQNRLLEMVTRITGRSFSTVIRNGPEVEAEAFAEQDAFKAMRGFQFRALFTKEYQTTFTGRTDNALLELPELSTQEVEEVIRESLSL